jgi:mannose-1-phosphate guanylyltransferase / mannose-6-phosphate isomerase
MQTLMSADNIFLVTNKDNYFNVFNQIKEVNKDFKEDRVITEPASLNTAPAMAYAAKYLAEKIKIPLDKSILFVPADHYIKDTVGFWKLIRHAATWVGDSIGTIGITPTAPETGYGYIKKGMKDEQKGYYKVAQFKEKPDRETAQQYLDSGEYVWNSGMYLFNLRTFIRELRQHATEIYSLMTQPMDEFIKNFSTAPSISIDYAISEKSDNVIVFEGEFGWSDIGSFDSLAEIYKKEVNPKHIGIDSENIYVHSDSDRLVATVGVDDLNVVETTDSILIQKRGRGEDVKRLVDQMKEQKTKELEHNLIVHRPWGKYEILVEEPLHKVKKITVYPGSKLSLQAHFHRVEHWIVIKGTAKIVHGENEVTLQENESTFIPKLTRHRLENPGKIGLEIIEVQTGNYLEEDDIIRYEDVYNRA